MENQHKNGKQGGVFQHQFGSVQQSLFHQFQIFRSHPHVIHIVPGKEILISFKKGRIQNGSLFGEYSNSDFYACFCQQTVFQIRADILTYLIFETHISAEQGLGISNGRTFNSSPASVFQPPVYIHLLYDFH